MQEKNNKGHLPANMLGGTGQMRWKKHSFHDYQNATLILWVDKSHKTTSKLPYATAQSTFKNQACHTHKKFFLDTHTQKKRNKKPEKVEK